MTLYLLTFNNYYNRKIVKFDSLSDYEPYIVHTLENANFNWADSIQTYHVFNYEGTTPDYCLVCDAEDHIIQRYWVTECHYNRGGQYVMSLYRDVIADYYDEVVNSTSFIRKATLPANNPLIFNSEDMTFNQIKKSETQLSDESGCPWLVAYITKKNDESVYRYPHKYTSSVALTANVEHKLTGSERVQVFSATGDLLLDLVAGDLVEPNWSVPITLTPSNIDGDLSGAHVLKCTKAMTFEVDNAIEEDITVNNIASWSYYQYTTSDFKGIARDIKYIIKAAETPSTTKYIYFNANGQEVDTKAGANSGLTCTGRVEDFSKTYEGMFTTLDNLIPASNKPSTVEALNDIVGLDGKIILDTTANKYYEIKVKRSTDVREFNSTSGTLYTYLYNQYISSSPHKNLSGTPSSQTFGYLIDYEIVRLELTQLHISSNALTVTVDPARHHTEDAVYDIVAVPYGNILYYLNGSLARRGDKRTALKVMTSMAKKYQEAG